ncbi:MAG: DUF1775 domain-containing protein [Candidatus Tectimicrobiota bacterium]
MLSLVCGLAAWGLGGVALVWGHADLDPRQSTPSKWETYTLNVPTETEAATTKVRLLVPREFEIEMLGHSEVWQITKSRDERSFIREVTWSGGVIPHQTFGEFKLLIKNPAAPGTYFWKIEQHYQDGSLATWDAQTQIVPVAALGGAQRAEEAWRTAQVATTVSFVALGISLVLILMTALNIFRSGRAPAHGEQG